MKRLGRRILCMFLSLTLCLGMTPLQGGVMAAEGPDDKLVSTLATAYNGDEERARESLQALQEAGIIDAGGNMVSLNVCEDGTEVSYAELAERIRNGEEVGEITVNGNSASPEQIVQIDEVSSILEIQRLLDEEIEITDEHVENLESLIEGIADGSIDVEEAMNGETAAGETDINEEASLSEEDETPYFDQDDYVISTGDVEASDGKYTQPFIDGSEYDANYSFDLIDPTNTAYEVDSRYAGVTLDGTVTLSCADTATPNSTMTVTATLDKAQTLPVSFDWNALGNTLGVTANGTVTWAAGESGDKSFEVTIPAKESDELWDGSRPLVINAGNIKNAVFAEDKYVWNKVLPVSASDTEAIREAYLATEIGQRSAPTYAATSANGSKTRIAIRMNGLPSSYPCDIIVESPSGYPYTLQLAEAPSWFDITVGNGDGNQTFTQETDVRAPWYDPDEWKRIYVVLEFGTTTMPELDQVSAKLSCKAPAIKANVLNISVPEGDYYSGMTVPVEVEFDQFVAAKEGVTLTINNVACTPLDGTDTETKKITFGYTVKDVDTGTLNVTEIAGVKNASGGSVNLGTSFTGLSKKSFGAEDNISIISDVKRNSILWDNAIYGISASVGKQEVTVMLPVSATDKAWVVNEIKQFDRAINMPLPDHVNATVAGYLVGAYFSADGGRTRYPVYGVEDGSDIFLVGRFTPPINGSINLRRDTVNLFMATEALNAGSADDVTKYLPLVNGSDYDGSALDGNGLADAGMVFGRSWSYYLKGGIRFEEFGVMDRAGYDAQTAEYDEATNSLKAENDSNILLRDAIEAQDGTEERPAQDPALQYDVEILANDEFINGVKNGIRAEDDSDMILSYQCSTRKNFSFTAPNYFTWKSSNEDVAVVREDNGTCHIVFTGEEGVVTFTLVAENGGEPFEIPTRTLRVMAGKSPFLNIPKYSRIIPTLTGTDTDVLMASNVTERNAALGKKTVFTAKLYAAEKSEEGYTKTGSELWSKDFTSTTKEKLTHITIPGAQLSEARDYAVEISTTYIGGTVKVSEDAGVETEANDTLSATAFLQVKQAPVKVTLNKLDKYYVTTGDIPTIGYTLTQADASVEYTVQRSGDTVSARTPVSGGTIPFTAGAPAGLKDVYTITVYARSSEAEDSEPWSVDSMLLTVYDENKLDIIIENVIAGEIGGTTGGEGTVADGTTVTMDNSGKLAGYGISGNAFKLSFDDFNTLRTDMSLQKIISANYGSGAWGLLSDKMQWESSAPDKVSVDYKQGGIYSDIRNYDYAYYAPDTDFLLVGKEKTNAPVTITATHANTGMQATFDVTTQTLEDKLYLFQFLPKAETDVVYINGSGVTRRLKSNSKGELAVYEPDGITEAVMAKSVVGGVTYVGTVYPKSLVSGERDIGALQLYPSNTVKLCVVSDAVLTFLTPGGAKYTGQVNIRAGVYKNGEYVPNALIRDINRVTVNESGRIDHVTSLVDGKVTIGFDPSQFKLSEDDEFQPGDRITYVIEYSFGDGTYCPGYVLQSAMGDFEGNVRAKDSLINMDMVSGSAAQPQIFKQTIQQYYEGAEGTTPTAYSRDVLHYTENIGISPTFSKTELFTYVALPGEAVGTDENGYTTYTSTQDFGFGIYKTDGKLPLTGQTGTEIAKDQQALRVLKLEDLEGATLFVFPFSSMPMVESVYTMTDDNMSADGITDKGAVSSAHVKAKYTKNGVLIRSDRLPFGVANITHQKDLTDKDGGAKELASEVKEKVNKQLDIGSVFKEVQVNSMLKNGFAFLGGLTGASKDRFYNMVLIPTEDPSEFRIAVLVGDKKLEEDEDEDGDGVSIEYDPDTMAEDIEEFSKLFSDKKDDDDDNGKIEFSFSGALYLTAKCDPNKGWRLSFTGGSIGTGIKGSYSWSQNFMCGPYPFFIEFEAGFGADIEITFVSRESVRAMLLDTTMSLSLEAFAGLGFDLSIVAFKLGIYGKIGASVNYRHLAQTTKYDMIGTKLGIDGEIGIKMEIKLLFVKYKKTYASTSFGWSKSYGQYDAIESDWEEHSAVLTGVTQNGRAFTMNLMPNDTAVIAIDGDAEIEDRDYLDIYERAWNNGVRLMSPLGSSQGSLVSIQTNAYPYADPVFTDDGEMFLYISDNGNSDELQSVVSYAVKENGNFADAGALYDKDAEDAVLADSDVVAAGSNGKYFAAWVKQLESPEKEMHAAATYDDIGMMMNATEIYAALYDNAANGWNEVRLTENNVADMAPTVASHDGRAIVAWRSLAATGLPKDGAEEDITASFNVENNINYRIYNNEGGWTEAAVAYNGSAGTVTAIDSAMASDGTAILVYTVRTGEAPESTETFYTVIGTNGDVLTTGRLTNDGNADMNAQVTAVGNQFVVGWYSEYRTTDNEDPDNETGMAHDIRLARIDSNGSVDNAFPESISGGHGSDIAVDFRFSAPVDNTDLNNVSITWSGSKESDKEEDAGKYEIKAVRFFTDGETIGVTSETVISETDKYCTVDKFDTYTDGSGYIYALILGSDYSNANLSVYDTIDLNALDTVETPTAAASTQFLNILEQTPDSFIKLGCGGFAAMEIEAEAAFDIRELMPGLDYPVQFAVKNTGTDKITSITVSGSGAMNKVFDNLTLMPGQSTLLNMTYAMPEGAVSDISYTITATGEDNGNGAGTAVSTGELVLNRPDVGIADMKILREEDGTREIQVRLKNATSIPLKGSGKTVKLAFYEDKENSKQIGETLTIDEAEYGDIDDGFYTYTNTLDMLDYIGADGEIPAEGVTVYAKAWVDDGDEVYKSDNTAHVLAKGLYAKYGELVTADPVLNALEDGTYELNAQIFNNSIQATKVVNFVAKVYGSDGSELKTIPLEGAVLELSKEHSETLNANLGEIEGEPETVELSYLCIRKPMPVEGMIYDGTERELVTAGGSSEGTIYYALGNDENTEPEESAYTVSVPTATNAGTYYVWYKVVVDGNQAGATVVGPLIVEIARAGYPDNAISRNTKYGTSGRIDIAELVAPEGEIGNMQVTDAGSVIEGSPSLNGTVLNYTFKNELANAGKFATITIPVRNMTNYEDYDITVTLNVVACEHTHTELINVKTPTCNEEGYTGDVACTSCGEVIEIGESIPINPDNHSYDEGVITREPSVFADGIKTFTCENCKHTYTEIIPRIDDGEEYGHLIEDVTDENGEVLAEVEAETDQDGSTVTTVTIDDEEVEKSVTDAEGNETLETKIWIGGLSASYTYTGKAIKPSFHVYDGKKELTAGKDYSVTYKNNKKIGETALITVSFKGSYKGTDTEKLNFTITPAVLGEDVVAKDVYTYTAGKSIKPVPAMKWAATGKSIDKKNFNFKYQDAEGNDLDSIKDAGEYRVIVTSKNESFTGDTVANITVADSKQRLLSGATVKISPNKFVYTGEEIVPEAGTYTLKLNGKTLEAGTDYAISEIRNNVNPGKATIVFAAIEGNEGGYVGEKNATFTIKNGRVLKDNADFTYSYSTSVPYAKGGAKPEIVITDGDTTLKAGTDYTVSYSKNTKVTRYATACMTIKGKGKYKGTIKKYFTVTRQDLSLLQGNVKAEDKVLKDSFKNTTVTITDLNGKKLKKGTDFVIDPESYTEPDATGTVTAVVTGKGNYEGSASITYRCVASKQYLRNISSMRSLDSVVYTGREIRLTNADLTNLLYTGSKSNPDWLVPGVDFEIAGYKANVKVGKAQVILQGIGTYAGTKTITFKITSKDGDYKGALIDGEWKYPE